MHTFGLGGAIGTLDFRTVTPNPFSCARRIGRTQLELSFPDCVVNRGIAAFVPTIPICVISGSTYADLSDCKKSSGQILD